MRHFSESPLRFKIMRCLSASCLCAFLALAGCATTKPPPEVPPPSKPAPPRETPAPKPPAAGTAGVLRQASWQELPGWREDNAALAWEPFLAGCKALSKQDAWRGICAAADSIRNPGGEEARRFFELNFTPFQVMQADGGEEGLITGYYEPLLKGSRKRSARFRYPVLGVPDDLLVIDLTDVYPELNGMRLRGRLDGRRVVPYYNREQIEHGRAAVADKVLFWVDDPIELFFLQIQGSGRIALDSGETVRVGYGDQNGYA